MKVRVDTTRYEFAHGKAPRGTGMWWFAFGSDRFYNDYGTYAEVKAAAVREARQCGASVVKVMS